LRDDSPQIGKASALWPWRPEVVDLASESSQIAQGGLHTRGKASRARGRLAAHGERSAGEIREERGALAGRPTCLCSCSRMRTHVPVPPVCCCRALPCSPSARGAAAGGLLFPRRFLWSSIEQETSRFASPFPLPHLRRSRCR
jgi:hypothetical protein